MHYKNGTEAHTGDHVIFNRFNGETVSGVIHSLNAGSEYCNGVVAVLVPGGCQQEYVTVGECLKASDCWTFVTCQLNAAKATPGTGAPVEAA